MHGITFRRPACLAAAVCLFTAALLAVAPPPSFAASEKISSQSHSYLRAPTPSWVVPVKPPAATATAASGPVSMTVLDDQISLLEDKPVRYMRYRIQVAEKTGLEMVSQVPVQFDPAYETLTLHELYVVRNGARLERLKTAKIRLIQREQQLDQLVYDGVVTALIVVPDVRVGDALEIAYSVRGMNPIFKNRFSDYISLALRMPISKVNIRVLYPPSRDIHYKVLAGSQQPSVSTVAGHRELLLSLENVPPVIAENNVPRWYKVYPELQLSEWSGWDEVEAWDAEQFQVPSDLSPELRAVVDDIRARATTDEDKAMAALVFVQDEIRYFGVEIGSSSHKPNHPNLTLSQRFGDCKDKTLLLVTLLRQLGIEAYPALVSYARQRALADQLPAATAFDHVITQARINGKIYWLDGTRTLQGRKLGTLGFEPYGKALVIGGGRGLSDVDAPAGDVDRIENNDEFQIRSYAEPVQLHSVFHYYGNYAERMRVLAHSKSQDEFSKEFSNEALARFPKAHVLDFKIEDDPEANIFTVSGQYELPGFFTYSAGFLKYKITAPQLIYSMIDRPDKVQRAFPLNLSFPMTLSSRQIINLPREYKSQGLPSYTVRNPHFVFTAQDEIHGQRDTLSFDLRVLRDAVMPGALPAYVESLEDVSRHMSYNARVAAFDPQRVLPELRKLKNDAKDHADRLLLETRANIIFNDDVIQSGAVTGSLLADAYLSRSIEEGRTERFEQELADADRAVALVADDSEYMGKRAEALVDMGRYKEAVAAFTLRQEHDPANRDLRGRGRANYFAGDFAAARDDFAATFEDAGDWQNYALIWLYLSQARQGLDGRAALSPYIQRTDLKTWPGPIVSYFLGDLDENALLTEARKDPQEARLQLCEVYFYIAQQALAENHPDIARKRFQNALDQHAVVYLEHRYAQLELERLH